MRYFSVAAILLWAACMCAIDVNWNDAEKVQTGTELLKFELVEPRLQKVNLMRIDLATEGLQFTGTAKDKDWGKPMPDHEGSIIHTLRVKTRDLMTELRRQGRNVIVGFNSAPWLPWEPPFDHKYAHPRGLGILDGEVICDTRPHTAEFVVYNDGKIDILPEVPEDDYPNIRLAASGFAVIMEDGEILPGSWYEKDLMPRIAYGLSRDRRYLYIVTVDGRQEEWSMGATGREVAEMLQAAGAYDAINMDGGGSATLCYWDTETNQPVTLTRHPKDAERLVGANIILYLDK